ncbi:MAG: hypothetical protein C4K49_06235 [Candidatus Thorarchaeota archaeon]|nr:MAG: hypothetical protein C4K49_06235 [Candidatus Thorarchaeota archaeon]
MGSEARRPVLGERRYWVLARARYNLCCLFTNTTYIAANATMAGTMTISGSVPMVSTRYLMVSFEPQLPFASRAKTSQSMPSFCQLKAIS